jgi:hypothetical protein
MMRAVKAHAVNPILGARDVHASTTYWCDELGFSCPGGVFEGVDLEGGVYAIVSRDDARVHLQIRRREVFAAPRESIESDAYIYVDDAQALYDDYVARGVSIHRPIEDSPYGLRDFVIETPDAHRIVFGSPI